MARRAPTYDDLLAIARLVESSARFSEVRLRSGDIEVEVKRVRDPPARELGPGPSSPGGAPGGDSTSVTPAKAGAESALPDLPPDAHLVRSPMVGTFYRAPEPGAKPFADVGARVAPDTVVCIIEVMKLMNSIEAGVAGKVTHVLAENGQPVEPGQPLFAIRKAR